MFSFGNSYTKKLEKENDLLYKSLDVKDELIENLEEQVKTYEKIVKDQDEFINYLKVFVTVVCSEYQKGNLVYIGD